MKINLKLCLLALVLVFSGQSLKAMDPMEAEGNLRVKRKPLPSGSKDLNKGLRHLDFKQVVSCLKERKLVQIGDQEYAVCLEHPKRYSALYLKEVPTNPCYYLGLGPKLLKRTDLENLPDPLPSFYVYKAVKDESGEYLTVNFMTRHSRHWPEAYLSSVPMEKRYWNEVHTEHASVPYFLVSFLLKKI